MAAAGLLGRVPAGAATTSPCSAGSSTRSRPARSSIAAVKLWQAPGSGRRPSGPRGLAGPRTVRPRGGARCPARAAGLDRGAARGGGAGTIAPATIDAAHRQRLVQQGNKAIRQRASALRRLRDRPRQTVVDAYRAGLEHARRSRAGPGRLRPPLRRVPQARRQGYEIGPDLAALTDRSPEALLTAILDPNREVDARYVSYSVALKDGRVASGMIAAETASAITLKREQGQTDVILRDEIDELASSGRSLMPEGLENDLKPADLADLIAFSPRRRAAQGVAGNQPETVRQTGAGPIRLDASTAAIFGPTLTYETSPGNLGYWQSADDHAAWSFQVDRPACTRSRWSGPAPTSRRATPTSSVSTKASSAT